MAIFCSFCSFLEYRDAFEAGEELKGEIEEECIRDRVSLMCGWCWREREKDRRGDNAGFLQDRPCLTWNCYHC